MSQLPGRPPDPVASRHRWAVRAAWFGAIVALVAWVGSRISLFDSWAQVAASDGTVRRVPVTWATVDHPFHVARLGMFLDALRHGEVLRWVGQHQGGYPAEFYPFGLAGLESVGWLATLGQLPVELIHKWTLFAVLLAPVIAVWLMARLDQRSPGIVLLALAIQCCVAGWWWSGGYRELIEWGLATNVAAATAQFIAVALLGTAMWSGSWRYAASASLLAGWAIYSNPRSLLALGAGIGAALLLMLFEPSLRRWNAAALAISPAVVAALVGAPELVSLARYESLYYFVHYEGYETLRDYLDSSVQAAGMPVFLLALVGLVVALARPGRPLARFFALAALCYAAGTALLVLVPLVGQLETTRLMPFQRYLTIALAVVAVDWGASQLGRLLPARLGRLAIPGILVAVSIVVALAYVVAPPAAVSDNERGLYPVVTTADVTHVDLENAVRQADSEAAPGTAILVLGNQVSWHDQLWSPLWTDRHIYADDWLWDWQTRHWGDFDPTTSHSYRSDASALDLEYLHRHGIGAVIVAGEASLAAARSPLLRQVASTTWDTYLVIDPVTLATVDDQNTELELAQDGAFISGVGEGGDLVARWYWYPRWTAAAAGTELALERRDDGYIEANVPPGTDQVTFHYGVTWLDWLARLLCIAGLLVAGWLVARPPRATTPVA